jgi:hypothetical protein
MRYAHVNQYMTGVIRNQPWSIFGRTVEEWIASNPEFGELAPDELYLSGDLEAATDTFNPIFANFVIDHLCEIMPTLDEGDAIQMKKFTTQATLLGLPQLNGQLMGSILSFPILCLVNLASYIASSGQGEAFLALEKMDVRTYLSELKGVGINGDDIVFKTRSENVHNWCHAVESVGSKASRGKSLLSEKVFTVNSELWTYYDKKLRPPSSIRPSLIFSLAHTRKCKLPMKDWIEYKRSSLLTEEARDYLQIESVLKLNIPTALGGLGIIRKFDLIDFLESRNLREELGNMSRTPMVRPKEYWEDYRNPFENDPKIMVVGSEAMRKEVRECQFGDAEGRPQWSRDKLDLSRLIKRIRVGVQNTVRFTTKDEICLLAKEYNSWWELGDRKVFKMPRSLYQMRNKLGLVDLWRLKRFSASASWGEEKVDTVFQLNREAQAQSTKALESIRSIPIRKRLGLEVRNSDFANWVSKKVEMNGRASRR